MRYCMIEDINKFGLSDELIDVLSRVHLGTMLSKYITSQNKINCVSFLLCNRPKIFEKMLNNNFLDFDDIIKCIDLYPASILCLPQEVIRNKDFQNKLIENVKTEWYDFLPTSIANNLEVQKKCGRTAKIYLENGLDKNGYNRDWINGNGELIYFFKLKGDFPIKSKLDYYKLYKEYLDSRISVQNFCTKYGIDSIKGFNDFLKRVEAESLEDFSKIKDVKVDVQRNFYNLSKETAKKIVDGEISFEEFLNDSRYNFNSTRIDLYFNTLSFNDRNIFSTIIMDYVEQNPYLVNRNFIKFLTSNNLKPTDSYNTFVRRNLQMPKDREYIQKYKKQMSKIKGHEKMYKRSDLYSTYIIRDKEYKVDDLIIDQAYAYATDNDYHISFISMSYLCKKIATGELTYSKETNAEKEELIDNIISLFKEEKNIEDYISAMKEKNSVIRK